MRIIYGAIKYLEVIFNSATSNTCQGPLCLNPSICVRKSFNLTSWKGSPSIATAKRHYNINAQERICSMINRTKVVIFIRGRPNLKQRTNIFTECNESQKLVELLENEKVLYDSIDILTDYNAEEGIKEYSNSDRIPQIYFKGELFNGCVEDLIKLKHSGKLNELFDSINVRRRK